MDYLLRKYYDELELGSQVNFYYFKEVIENVRDLVLKLFSHHSLVEYVVRAI